MIVHAGGWVWWPAHLAPSRPLRTRRSLMVWFDSTLLSGEGLGWWLLNHREISNRNALRVLRVFDNKGGHHR